MIDALQFLWPPFLVAVCLVGIHAYFGIQVLARKVIFVDLALAQIAALGATVAFMLGHPAQSVATYGYSLSFTFLAAVLLAFTRSWSTRVPQEALIGVIYVVAAATAILLIDRAPQGAEHLKQILTGNILTSGLNDVALIAPLYAAIGLLHWVLRRHMAGTGSLVWEFIFYATFGIVVTSSVAIAGVLLVFSFLIIPAAIGVMFADSLSRQLAIGWIAGTLVSAAGLAASFVFDLPTGASMVCAFGVSLALAGVLYPFLRGDRRRSMHSAVTTARWVGAIILAGSALLFVVAPRADQPLFDFAEYLVPSLRTVYFTRAEATTFADASEHAERYRMQAEQLNETERRNRT
ncbi:MAG: metal ABC transporter permease, partial [Pseudolabrys sp.]